MSQPTAGHGRAWPSGMAAAMIGAAALLVGCSVDARPGDPALPAGFVENGVPSAGLRAYAYINTGSPVTVPGDALGEQGAAPGDVTMVSMETLVNRPSSEYAVRTEFLDAATASHAAEIAAGSAGSNRWVRADGEFVMAGRSDSSSWGEDLQAAWTGGDRASIAGAFPGVWNTMRLLPEEPPATPVAAGFVRNVSGMIEELLGTADVSVPGLESSLNLMRMENVAAVAYADNLERLPRRPSRAGLRDSQASILAVATSSYPGFVVDFLFSRFSERAGLEPTELDGGEVFYRALDQDMHLMVKNYGSTFFFALSSNREGAEEVLRSVIRSQKSR